MVGVEARHRSVIDATAEEERDEVTSPRARSSEAIATAGDKTVEPRATVCQKCRSGDDIGVRKTQTRSLFFLPNGNRVPDRSIDGAHRRKSVMFRKGSPDERSRQVCLICLTVALPARKGPACLFSSGGIAGHS